MSVRMGASLELEEFGAQSAGVDVEGTGGGWATGEGGGEECVVGLLIGYRCCRGISVLWLTGSPVLFRMS